MVSIVSSDIARTLHLGFSGSTEPAAFAAYLHKRSRKFLEASSPTLFSMFHSYLNAKTFANFQASLQLLFSARRASPDSLSWPSKCRFCYPPFDLFMDLDQRQAKFGQDEEVCNSKTLQIQESASACWSLSRSGEMRGRQRATRTSGWGMAGNRGIGRKNGEV